MKTPLSVLLFLICHNLYAAPAARVTPPSLTVSQLQHGRVTSRYPSGDALSGTSNTKETTRISAIRVQLSAFSKPEHPYEVQCFFVAKDPARRRYIYDAQRFLSDGIRANFPVYGRDLFGGSETVTQIARYVTITELDAKEQKLVTKTVPVNDTQTTKTAGSKHEGWVVRVLSEGKVVRLAASLAQLQAFAEKEAALLDKVALESAIEPTPEP